ncbi:MAG: tetratricopeptide repeat protein [Alphaproteobacteria bacterium]
MTQGYHQQNTARVALAIALGAALLGASIGQVAGATTLKRCQTLSEKGIHGAAIRACAQVLANPATSAPARALGHLFRANSLYSTGANGDALREINAALALAPNAGRALALRGAIHLRNGNTAGALADFNAAEKYGFTEPRLYRMRANAFLRGNNPAAAVGDLQKVVKRNPKDAVSLIRLALALDAKGNSKAALELAVRAVKANPDYTTARGVRAAILNRLGRTQDALADFDKALALTNNKISYRVGRAELLARDNRAPQALRELDQVLRDQPGHRVARQLKADILQAAGRNAEAFEILNALDTVKGGALLRRARLALSLKKFDAAAKDYSTGLKVSPSGPAYFERAQARMHQGRWAEAAQDMTSALKLSPDLAQQDLHFLRGRARYKSGNIVGAVADFSVTLDQNSKNAQALIWRSLGLADLGQFEDALADAQGLVQLLPNQARSFAVLGDIYLKAGRLSQGLVAHQRAIEIDPGYATSQGRLRQFKNAG